MLAKLRVGPGHVVDVIVVLAIALNRVESRCSQRRPAADEVEREMTKNRFDVRRLRGLPECEDCLSWIRFPCNDGCRVARRAWIRFGCHRCDGHRIQSH